MPLEQKRLTTMSSSRLDSVATSDFGRWWWDGGSVRPVSRRKREDWTYQVCLHSHDQSAGSGFLLNTITVASRHLMVQPRRAAIHWRTALATFILRLIGARSFSIGWLFGLWPLSFWLMRPSDCWILHKHATPQQCTHLTHIHSARSLEWGWDMFPFCISVTKRCTTMRPNMYSFFLSWLTPMS